jgi:hypothetical protein
MDEVLKALEAELPPVIYRTNPRFKELVGISSRTMANADSRGEGPAERVRLGRVVGYPRKALLAWLAARLIELDPQAKVDD